jgi:hypothetical protein
MREGAVPLGMPTQGALAWRSRIRVAGSREVAGAGIALGTQHLLSCAHVVAQAGGPDSSVDVDLVAWSPPLATTARVLDGCWHPERSDGTADLAILELADPVPRDSHAGLRKRTVRLNLPVRVLGFPAGLEFGHYVEAKVAGPSGPGNEWVQIDTPPHQPIVTGFSGGAVLDPDSGEILGMLVSRSIGAPQHTAWMIPVETILRYFPFVEQWTVGTPGVSPSLRQRSSARPRDDQPAREITRFFTDRSQLGGVHVITTGDPDSPASVAVRWVVTLADRQQRVANPDEVQALVEDGSVPPAGSIDLALDVTGLTVAEVVERILDRLGHSSDQPMQAWSELLADPPRMSLVVVGIDHAVDPDQLVDTVLEPLARVARERGLRILLSFARQSVSSQSLERMPQRLRADRLADKVGRLEERMEQTRRSKQKVAKRIAGIATVPDRIASLRQDLAAIQATLPAGELGQLTTMIDECEAAVEAATSEVNKARRDLNGLVDQHRALDRRVELYRGMAGPRNGALTMLYREARQLVDQRPCDLSAAAAAADRYGRAVTARIHGAGMGGTA